MGGAIEDGFTISARSHVKGSELEHANNAKLRSAMDRLREIFNNALSVPYNQGPHEIMADGTSIRLHFTTQTKLTEDEKRTMIDTYVRPIVAALLVASEEAVTAT